MKANKKTIVLETKRIWDYILNYANALCHRGSPSSISM